VNRSRFSTRSVAPDAPQPMQNGAKLGGLPLTGSIVANRMATSAAAIGNGAYLFLN